MTTNKKIVMEHAALLKETLNEHRTNDNWLEREREWDLYLSHTISFFLHFEWSEKEKKWDGEMDEEKEEE